jgi:histidinol-phosphate aminotransferase
MLSPRPHLTDLPDAVHGSPDYRELADLGIDPAGVLDFSANINPYGPPPGVKSALRRVPVADYPDSAALALRAVLAAHLNTHPERITVGSGATELIRLAVQAFIGPGDRVLIPAPSYGEYATSCRLAGAEIISLPASEKNDFRLDVDALVKSIRDAPPRAIFIGSPNNPTGEYLPADVLRAIADAAKKSLLVIDEAYASLADSSRESADYLDRENVIVIRSLTKDYALAGLRLGYALSQPQTAALLARLRPPWSVSAPAQAAGLAALAVPDYAATCRPRLARARNYLMRQFEELGYRVIPSAANFFLVNVCDGAGFRRALLKNGLLVRDAASFGLPAYVRVAPRKMPECRRLIQAVSEITNQQ